MFFGLKNNNSIWLCNRESWESSYVIKTPALFDYFRPTAIKIVETLVAKHGEEFMLTSLPKLLELQGLQEEFEGADKKVKSFSAQLLAECCPYNTTVLESVVASLLTRTSESPGALLCLNRIVEKVTEFSNLEQVATLNSILIEKLGVFDKIYDTAVEQHAKVRNGKADSNSNQFEISLKILRNLMRSSAQSVQQDLVNQFWKERIGDESWERYFSNFSVSLYCFVWLSAY